MSFPSTVAIAIVGTCTNCADRSNVEPPDAT